MRKSFNGLHSLIMNDVPVNDLPGRMYIFLNKKGSKVKVFYWDNDGFAIWYKSLKQGVFHFPTNEKKYLEMSPETLNQILLGFNLKYSKKHFRFKLSSV